MKIDFLSPHDLRWHALLEQTPHQFYHLPGYSELWAAHDRGQPEAVLVSRGTEYFFLPYTLLAVDSIEMVHGSGYYDLRSAYGYPGPLIHAQSPDFLSRALKVWAQAMRERKVISGFVRLDPLARCHANELAEIGQLCIRGSTVSVDLADDEARLWQQIRLPVRTSIRRARAAGLQVRAHLCQPPWEQFCRVYYETMDRVQASQAYYFSLAHFETLARLLGDRLWIGTAEDPEGEALAVGLFIDYQGIAHHHLQGTTGVGLHLSAAKLLVHMMTLLAKQRGNHVLHLGGGRGALADSLFQFKSAFSKRRHPFLTWHLTFLPQECRRLAADRGDLTLSGVAEFFPPYRR